MELFRLSQLCFLPQNMVRYVQQNYGVRASAAPTYTKAPH